MPTATRMHTEPLNAASERPRTHALNTVPHPTRVEAPIDSHAVAIDVTGMSFFYGAKQALLDITIQLRANLVTAFIGPSGCGKSTFLRTLNRMNDIIAGRAGSTARFASTARTSTAPTSTSSSCGARVGMVFQKSNPFPKSIYDNVAYGLRMNRLTRPTRPTLTSASKRA